MPLPRLRQSAIFSDLRSPFGSFPGCWRQAMKIWALRRAIGAVQCAVVSIILGAESNKNEIAYRCRRTLNTKTSHWLQRSSGVPSSCWDWAV